MSRRSNLFGVGITTLPSWADYTALPAGNFIEFTLNTPDASGVLMQAANLVDWCGGVFVPDYGTRGGVAYLGGGEHSTWVDSRSDGGQGQQGVYVLDCDTRLYSRKCYPVVNHTGVLQDGTGSTTDAWGAYADDGSPQSKHTYQCVSYMPASWGGGSSGSVMTVAKSGGFVSGQTDVTGYSGTWRFDLSKSSHTVASPAVTKITGASLYDFGSGPGARINEAPYACIDTLREGWWATHRHTSGWGARMVFTSKAGVVSAPQGVSYGAPVWYAALHHFADDDTVIALSDDYGPSGEWKWQVHVWQAGTSNAWALNTNVTRQAITETYGAGIPAYPQIGEMFPRWSSILGCFVGLDAWYPPNGATGATTIRVWKITPPPSGQRFTGAWSITWELVTAKSGTESTNFFNMAFPGFAGYGDAGVANGIYGRFVECPSLRAFVWTRAANKPGQLIRLQGM